MSNGNIFKLLDGLIEQTRTANITWDKTVNPHEYVWNGSSGSVKLTSIDADGDFPVRLTIRDTEQRLKHNWLVTDDSDPGDEPFDNRVRTLWHLVSSSNDVVASLIHDLEMLPPF